MTTASQRALVQKAIQRLADRSAQEMPKRRHRRGFISASQADMAYAQALLEAINGGLALAENTNAIATPKVVG